MATQVPDWNEYSKLRQLKVEPLLDQAAELKLEIAGLTQRFEELKLIIAAKMAAAEAPAIAYNGFTFVFAEGGETRTLDREWAEKTLLMKGVTSSEIKKHTKVSQRKASLRVTAPKED